MRKKTRYLGFLGLVFFVVTGACAPRYNVVADKPSIPVPQSVQQDEDTLVFVALSGGGTRAAAVSWKTLESFREIPYTYRYKNGKMIVSTLADEIDYISGISGGSFAAAAWCLHRDNMDIFRNRFINRNIQRELAKGLFYPPWQIFRLLFPGYDRINMASELYDRTVFGRKTFADLPAHPKLWIHATHLALGTTFTFTREYFDLLDSDLSSYPIGYACAASSAFPILLSPMTVINYGESTNLSEDDEYRMAKLSARKYIEKDFYARMREFYNDKTNKYMHLADGGLVDNQGLQPIVDQFDTNGIINTKLNDKENPLKRLIIINVNAGVHPQDLSCKSPNAPHVTSVIKYTMVTSMDILSAKRWMRIKALCGEVRKTAIDIGYSTEALSRLEKPYTIEINFRNAASAEREAFNKLPTSFHLNEEQLRLIDDVVPVLVAQDPDMVRLKKTLEKNWQ